VSHLADRDAIRIGLDRQALDPDLQHALLRQDLDDGAHVLRDAALVAQLGDVLDEPDGGSLQGVTGADPGSRAPQDTIIHCGLGVCHGKPFFGRRVPLCGGKRSPHRAGSGVVHVRTGRGGLPRASVR
jgi:hypothetical protein